MLVGIPPFSFPVGFRTISRPLKAICQDVLCVGIENLAFFNAVFFIEEQLLRLIFIGCRGGQNLHCNIGHAKTSPLIKPALVANNRKIRLHYRFNLFVCLVFISGNPDIERGGKGLTVFVFQESIQIFLII